MGTQPESPGAGPVADVAECLGRSLHATEMLLVRARTALRRIYQEEGSGDG